MKQAVDDLLKTAFHLSEVDGRLRFMSEAVADLNRRQRIIAGPRRHVCGKSPRPFTPAPTAKLKGTRSVQSGRDLGNNTITLEGERVPCKRSSSCFRDGLRKTPVGTTCRIDERAMPRFSY